MGDFDPAFIQEPEHRPKPAVIEADGIPQIDLLPYITSSPNTNPEAIHNLVDQIHDACKNWGFFQVINHGVPIESREKIQLAAKRFFDQSTEEKRQVKRGEKNPFGYYDTEHTKNVRDWKEVFDFTVDAPAVIPVSYESDDEETVEYGNQWPQYPPELRYFCMTGIYSINDMTELEELFSERVIEREVCEEYVKDVQKLSYKLLALISLSLNLPEDRFKPFFKDHATYVRFNHYPPCLAPDLALGVGHHKDWGALTILAQDDVGGLEVKRKSDGEWIFVKPTPNAFIINVGDVIQVWSNDVYESVESVEHRARVNSIKERFSIPFFMNPAHYTVVEPLAELTNEQSPAKYKAYNWGKFYAARKYSNFKKLDIENIQIYHFKKPDERKTDDVVSRIENVVV